MIYKVKEGIRDIHIVLLEIMRQNQFILEDRIEETNTIEQICQAIQKIEQRLHNLENMK